MFHATSTKSILCELRSLGARIVLRRHSSKTMISTLHATQHRRARKDSFLVIKRQGTSHIILQTAVQK